MTKRTVWGAIASLTLVACTLPIQAQPTPLLPGKRAEELLAVLQSDAPLKDKTDACRQLAVVGTEAAVPVLAKLLGDPQLSHMARYALEPMPFDSVDDALREALGRLEGRLLVGVIASIGARRDAKAVEPLTRLLGSPDADVAQAAARALGSIGTPDAAEALRRALSAPFAGQKLALHEGLFRAAELLAAKGQRDTAIAIYDQLCGLDQTAHQVRTGAVRGAMLGRGKDGLPLLKDYLAHQDYRLFAAAVATAQEMPGTEVTEALCAKLAPLPADRQIVVVQSLGWRADAAALPTLLSLAQQAEKSVRVAAIRAAVQVGSVRATPVLVGLLGDPDSDVAQAARIGLATLPGREVDDAVMAMFASTDVGTRLTGLELIGQRRIRSAIPSLLRAAGDRESQIRLAALKRLGEMAGSAELDALVDLLLGFQDAQDVGAAEQALAAVCARADQPDAYAAQLVAGLARAPQAQRASLVRVLGALGGNRALEAVRTALADAAPEVRLAAVRALATWRTHDVLPDLLRLAQNGKDATEKLLGLRAYLTWAANAELPIEQRLAICREATGLSQRTEEKKLLLAALGNLPAADAVALVVPHLDDAATQEEASQAVVALADKLLKGPDASRVASNLIAPLEKVAQSAGNADLARRARALARQAKNQAGAR